MRRSLFVAAFAVVAFTAACSNSPTAPVASKSISPKTATHDDVPVDTLHRGYTVPF